MDLKNEKEVTSISHSSYVDYNDYDDCNDDNESSIVSKLMLKCKSLLSKKKHYKYELLNLSKEFESLKNDFSKLVKSNKELANELKSSNSLKD